MKNLLLDLLTDHFGLSKGNLKTILQLVAEDDEAAADDIEKSITEITVYTPSGNVTRAVIR